MIDCCILFSYYHRNNTAQQAVVRDHYARLCHDNPDMPVVPLVCGYSPLIPGTIDVRHAPQHWVDAWAPGQTQRSALWHHGDQIFWRYLLMPEAVEAERYVLFEWDTFSHGMGVREFYREVWDGPDVAGARVVSYTPRPDCYHAPRWEWFAKLWERLPAEELIGIVPFCGTFLRRRAAEAIIHTDPESVYPGFREAFAELRPFVIAYRVGMTFAQLTTRKTLLWTRKNQAPLLDEPGIYHPCKELTPFHRPLRSVDRQTL